MLHKAYTRQWRFGEKQHSDCANNNCYLTAISCNGTYCQNLTLLRFIEIESNNIDL